MGCGGPEFLWVAQIQWARDVATSSSTQAGVFLFLYFSKSFFTEIYFWLYNLQICTPTALCSHSPVIALSVRYFLHSKRPPAYLASGRLLGRAPTLTVDPWPWHGQLEKFTCYNATVNRRNSESIQLEPAAHASSVLRTQLYISKSLCKRST